MARLNAEQMENFNGGGTGGGFFSLKNDKDTARVRFLFNGIDDVSNLGLSVHEVQVGDKKRAVNCLREYGGSIEDCPFCRAQIPIRAKYFIPIYNIEQDKVQIWERGKKFGNKLSSLCGRYQNLVSHVFEIERNGMPGDQQTTYEIYETGADNTTLNDFEEVPDALGSVVLNKTFEDMQYFVDRGVFPDDMGNGNNSGIVRRGGDNRAERRTPSNPNGGRGERF